MLDSRPFVPSLISGSMPSLLPVTAGATCSRIRPGYALRRRRLHAEGKEGCTESDAALVDSISEVESFAGEDAPGRYLVDKHPLAPFQRWCLFGIRLQFIHSNGTAPIEPRVGILVRLRTRSNSSEPGRSVVAQIRSLHNTEPQMMYIGCARCGPVTKGPKRSVSSGPATVSAFGTSDRTT